MVPVQGEASPFILPSANDVVLTQLQDGVLHSMELLQKARYVLDPLESQILSLMDLHMLMYSAVSASMF